MITIEAICRDTRIERAELERWISYAWVRPDGAPGAYSFRAIDTAGNRSTSETVTVRRVGR